MSQQVNIQDSVTLIPSGYTDLTSLTTSTSYPVDNGYADTSSTTYARFTIASGATGYLYYTFTAPSIPTGATIDSVTAQAKVRVSSTTRVTNTVCQLYSGTTAKGSNTTFASTSSSNVVTLTPGTWTLSELSNIRMRIGGTGSSSSGGGGSSSRYIYFYGATVVINYTISGTQYTIAATSQVSGATASPSTQNIMEGGSATVTIEASSIDDIMVTDNNVDVTSSLVRHDSQSGTYSPTFIPSSFDSTNSVYNTTAGDNGNGIYSTNYIENGLADYTSTTRCALYSVQGQGSVSVMYYNFDCSSIPQGATINSVSCQFKGGTQGTNYYSAYIAQLTTGTTEKGSSQSVTGSNTSASTVTIDGGSSWTRAELDDIKIKFQVTRGSSNTTTDSTWSFYGATLTVSYSVSPENPYYWTYDLTNIDDDHIIVIEEAGAYVPPEEDPEYTYWSLTISSINATTNPGTGTTRVVEGTNQTITITPSDPQLTLALDNGVDITSQLVGGVPTNTYSVATASGASYGFALNANNYYESQNAGQASSAAVARVTFNLETSCTITFRYINYAESTYDYGIFGNIDTALGTTYTADTNAYLICSTAAYNVSTEQTVTYTMSAGTHFIDVKYRKDSYTDSNNDSLQFKVEITALEGGDYTYTLNDITAKHSLIFVFGAVDYYFITSSGTDCRLFPDGQQVKLEGDSYKLTIVPDDITDTVTITDNGSSGTLERLDGYDKDNNPVVSYNYRLTNIQAAHNLMVTCTAVISDYLYLKLSGTWTQVAKVWVKEDGTWVEQDLSYLSDENIQSLIPG